MRIILSARAPGQTRGFRRLGRDRTRATYPGPLTDRLGSTSVGALAMDPQNPDVLYLGLGDPFGVAQPGVVSSTDGGETWSDPVFLSGSLTDAKGKQQSTLASTVRDLQVDPASSLHILVATDVGLFQSFDAGRSFSQAALPSVQSYAQAWSMVHFLYEASGGKHRAKIEAYFKKLKDGGSPREAYDEAFGGAIEELQKEWLEYVKKMEPLKK